MKQLLSEISQATLNLVFPIHCQGCDVKLPYDNIRYLCQNCLEQIRFNRPPFCIRCGRPLTGSKDIKTLCPDCLNRNFYFERAWQCCEYRGLIKELIHKFKYNKNLFLKGALVEILNSFAKTYIDYKRIDAIIPVPMHRVSINKRGFNQSALLSRGLSKTLNLTYIQDCLSKAKKTEQQVTLKKKERLTNIKGAFYVKKDINLKGKRLLLVDDVFTTGATVDECSKALTAAGAKTVWVLALARGA